MVEELQEEMEDFREVPETAAVEAAFILISTIAVTCLTTVFTFTGTAWKLRVFRGVEARIGRG